MDMTDLLPIAYIILKILLTFGLPLLFFWIIVVLAMVAFKLLLYAITAIVHAVMLGIHQPRD